METQISVCSFFWRALSFCIYTSSWCWISSESRKWFGKTVVSHQWFRAKSLDWHPIQKYLELSLKIHIWGTHSRSFASVLWLESQRAAFTNGLFKLGLVLLSRNATVLTQITVYHQSHFKLSPLRPSKCIYTFKNQAWSCPVMIHKTRMLWTQGTAAASFTWGLVTIMRTRAVFLLESTFCIIPLASVCTSSFLAGIEPRRRVTDVKTKGQQDRGKAEWPGSVLLYPLRSLGSHRLEFPRSVRQSLGHS